MTEQSYQPQINLTAFENAGKQRWLLRVLLALSVLAVLVLAVMYYSWFGNTPAGASNQGNVKTSNTTAEKARHVSSATFRRTSSKHRADAVVPPMSETTPEAQLKSPPGIIESTIRSPLALDVISGGGRHQLIGTRDDSIYLDSQDKTLAATNVADANAGPGQGVIKAVEQTRLSPGAVELASPPVASADLVLAKSHTMEGSVVLLAQIDKDGNIQNVHVIGGPEIFFGAAREAIKQWRFKPYYESGQAVETEAKITVKFAISTH